MFFLLFFILLSVIWLYGAESLFGPVLFSDEYGYWAAAAWMTGKDWSEVSSCGYYYSYGYSLLLIPVMTAVKDPQTAYRIGTACNTVLLFGGLLGLYGMARRLCPKVSGGKAALICFAAICTAGNIFYMQMTLPEILLQCLFPLVTLCLWNYLRKPGYAAAFLTALLLVYLYFVHMRTVGFVLAALFIVFLSGLRQHRTGRYLKMLVLWMILLSAAGYMVKEVLTAGLYRYADSSVLAVNDYAGQFTKLAELLEADGIKRLLISFTGKVFYLGCASFGLFYGGIAYLCSLAGRIRFKKDTEVETRVWISLYLIVGIAVQTGISAVFTVSGERIDYLLYGRYNELFLPIVIVPGIVWLVSLENRKKRIRVYAVYAAVQGLAAAVLYTAARRQGITGIYGYFVTGISYALDSSETTKPEMLWKVYAVSCLGALLLLLLTAVRNREKAYAAAAGAVVLWGITLGLYAAGLYIYPHNRENLEDIRLSRVMRDMGKEIYFIQSPGVMYVDLIQYMLPDRSIRVRGNDTAGPEDCVLIYKDNKLKDDLMQTYETYLESSHFFLFYTIGKSASQVV